MMTTKKFYSIIVLMFIPALFLCAQTTMDFVCRVIPSKNDEVYKTLQNARERFNEFNYEDEAYEIKNFLNKNGCMGFVIRDEAGKKYVFTSSSNKLSTYTTFDVTFASESYPVLHDLKLSALDSENNFMLIELPADYTGKALNMSSATPTLGQNVVIPDFSGTRLELQSSAITESSPANSTFKYSFPQPVIGSPVLLHDMNTATEYTLLGINCPSKGNTGPTFITMDNTSINGFMKRWPYLTQKDKDLPLNLFLEMVSSSSSNELELGTRFASTKLTNSLGADLFMSKKDFYHSYYNKKYNFYNNPYFGLTGWIACYIKDLFNSDKEYYIDSLIINGEIAKVAFTDGENTVESEWIKENDLWKISYIQGLAEKTDFKKNNIFNNNSWGFDEYYGDPFLINVKTSLLVPTVRENKGIDIEALCSWQFLAGGLFYQQERLEMETTAGIEERNAYTVGLAGRLQFPVDIKRLMIIPFIEGRFGFTNVHELFDDKSSRLYFGVDYGIDVAFDINQNFAPYLSFSGNNVGYNRKEKSNNFSFSIGLRFLGICDFGGDWI